ncbi:hypothetical protein [Altericista sp. CCNU0014]|uniref:hypothetical protein n=1 Tax=Altericista sp. CCNU0014 TaxID=3082949 RepID=UPI00384C25E2
MLSDSHPPEQRTTVRPVRPTGCTEKFCLSAIATPTNTLIPATLLQRHVIFRSAGKCDRPASDSAHEKYHFLNLQR